MPGPKKITSQYFKVIAEFADFQVGDRVELSMEEEFFAVRDVNEGSEFHVPYSDMRLVCHCEGPQQNAAGWVGIAPWLLSDGESLAADFAEQAVGMAMEAKLDGYNKDRKESGANKNMQPWIFLLEYRDGEETDWLMLKDEDSAKAGALATNIAECVHIKKYKNLLLMNQNE